MKKTVKGKIVKHYCDCCGKNIYDCKPKKSELKSMSIYIPEYTFERYCEFRSGIGKGNREEYCIECYKKLFE